MNTWSDGEIETLIRMWPHSSAGQIARCMHRSRESICGKVLRLRAHGVAIAWGGSRGKGKLFSVNPRVKARKLYSPASQRGPDYFARRRRHDEAIASRCGRVLSSSLTIPAATGRSETSTTLPQPSAAAMWRQVSAIARTTHAWRSETDRSGPAARRITASRLGMGQFRDHAFAEKLVRASPVGAVDVASRVQHAPVRAAHALDCRCAGLHQFCQSAVALPALLPGSQRSRVAISSRQAFQRAAAGRSVEECAAVQPIVLARLFWSYRRR